MKKILLIGVIAFLTHGICNAQLYADFEDVTPKLTSFSQNSNYSPSVMENPWPDDNNPSEMVYGGSSVVGTWEGSWFDCDDFIDFSNSFTFTMLVNAEAEGQVMLKIEDKTDNTTFIETPVDYTETDEWQLLSFTVEGVDADVSDIYNRIAIFMDFGSEEVGNMWYWDMLVGPDGYQGTSVESYDRQNRVYPNPCSDVLKIRSTSKMVELKLLNLAGQDVLCRTDINSVSVNLSTSELKPGIYFVRTKDVDGRISVSKIYKN